MKKLYYYSILLISVLLLNIQSLMGQNMLVWNLRTPTASTGTEATFNATYYQNLELSTLARGAGAPAAGGCGYGFVGNFGISSDKATAIANNAYFEFKVQAKDSCLMYLDKLKAIIRMQTYSAKTYQWQYSIDGLNFVDIGSPITPDISEIDVNDGVMQPEINLSDIAALQGLKSLSRVTFRLYAWGGSTPGELNPTWVNFGLGKTTTTVPSLAIEGYSVKNDKTLAWNFYGSDGKATSFYSTSKNNNLEISNLIRGAGSSGINGNGNGFTAAQTVSASAEEAETNQAYFEFNVKPKSGSTASLSNISANIRTQTYSGKTYQWKYSLNGGSFVNIGSPVTVATEEVNVNNGVIQPLIDLTSITDLQNTPSTSTVVFRLYAWGGTTPAVDATDKTYVNFGFGKSTTSTPSLIINGTVSGDSPPTYNAISAWEFSTVGGSTTPNPSPITGSFNATTLNTNLNSGVLSRGSGLAVGALFYSYAASLTGAVTGVRTKTEAETNNEYFQIELSPKTNTHFSVLGLKFKIRRLAAGPTAYCWKYSNDGTTFTEVGNGVCNSTESNGEAMQPLNLSNIEGLQDKTATITLRLYTWGMTSSTSVFALGRYAAGDTSNSVAIYGQTVNNGGTTAVNSKSVNEKMWVEAGASSIILNVNRPVSEQAIVCISDISGRNMFSKKIELESGLSKISLPVSLVNGIYILTLASENGLSTNLKFIR